jgi:ATP-dependent Clp protease adaptor protein ClpS
MGDDEEKRRELEREGGTQTLIRPSQETKPPTLYKVVILNDDFTPREFVVHVLKRFFNKNETDATALMLQVHMKGAGVAGVFTYEIAETKAYQVNSYARANQYPLKTIVEEA